MTNETTDFLVLTPTLMGADGISRLSRSLAHALSEGQTEGQTNGKIRVWSLMDKPDTRRNDFSNAVAWQGAGGSRARYCGWALREAARYQSNRVVVSVHVHLAPVAIPLTFRGAHLVQMLVGIESWKLLNFWQFCAVRKAARLISISTYSEKEFRRANPRCSDLAVEVCHPGIPDIPPETAEAARADGAYALIVGRMSASERYKGHDELLDIWPSLIRECPQARLVVVGNGDDRARLERKARASGLGDAVHFTGQVSESDLLELYAGCSFFAMPSAGEGFGLVYLEAMRAGKACIGGGSAATEIIQDGSTGFIIREGDLSGLRQALRRLWDDPELRISMGTRGRQRYLAAFTSVRFADRFLATLRMG